MRDVHQNAKLMVYILTLLFLSGCLKTEVSLSGDDYQIIDSLYNKQKESLTPILDSICVEFQDSVMQLWIDSIMEERQKEIDKLIGQ